MSTVTHYCAEQKRNFNMLSIHFTVYYSLFCPLFTFLFLYLHRKLIIWVDRPLPLWALQVRYISTLLCKHTVCSQFCINECTHMCTSTACLFIDTRTMNSHVCTQSKSGVISCFTKPFSLQSSIISTPTDSTHTLLFHQRCS